MDDELISYAGRNYWEPKSVRLGSVEFDDFPDIDALIAGLVAFRERHKGALFEQCEAEGGCRDYLVGFRASRLETPEEVQARIEQYKGSIERQKKVAQVARRAEYERLKREFGDA